MKRGLSLGGLLLVLLWMVPAAAQGPGLFVRPDCTTITGPVTGQSWCFDATAQLPKVWNGSAWVQSPPIAAGVAVDVKADYGAKGDGVTDDTVAINAAIAAACSRSVTSASGKGRVFFPTGDYLVSSINATGLFGCTLQGTGQASNTANAVGTAILVRLLPKTAGKNVLDLTASYQVNVVNLQIGTTVTCGVCATPGVGILIAQKQGNAQSSLINLRNVVITGSYSTAALYNVSVGDSVIYDTNLYNFQDAAVYTAVFSRDNPASVTSDYQTIISSSFGGGRWDLYNSEIHERGKVSGASTGFALRLRGIGGWAMFGGIVTGSGPNTILLEQDAATLTNPSNIMFQNVDFASDNGTAPAANFKTTSTVSGFTCLHCTSLVAAPNQFTGTGTYQATMGGAASLAGRTTPGSAIAGNTTTFFGSAGTNVADVGAATTLSVAAIVDRLDVQLDVSPGGTQTVTVTLEKNGVDTAVTCTITGVQSVCVDSAHYVLFVPGDRYSWKYVSSLTAAAAQAWASIRTNPF